MIGGGVRESPLRFDYWRSLPHRAHVLKAKRLLSPDPTPTALFCFPPSSFNVYGSGVLRDAFYYATILLSCQLSWLDSSSIWFLQMESKVRAFYHFYWGGNEGIQ